jgi:HK97 family phage major capsid protein
MATSPKRPLVNPAAAFFGGREIPKMDAKKEMALRRHLKLSFVGELSERGPVSAQKVKGWRDATLAACRALHDLAEKETRDFTADEKLGFDEGMRLVDYWGREPSIGGRLVPPEQIGGVEERDSRRGDPPLRFVNDKGQEVRGLLLKDSMRSAATEELPDGIQPEELSFGRFLRAAASGDWRNAQAEKRALGGSADVGGGYLVPSILSADVIDLARNNTVCLKAGAVTIPMTSSTLSLARLTQDIVPGWKVENQPGTFADAQFGSVKLQARTLMALAAISVELFQDASNIDQLLESSLAKVLAIEIDRAALRGDGTSSQPIGVKNAAGVTVTNLATNGLTLIATNAYQTFSNGILTILNKNGNPNAVVMAPRTKIELDQLTNTLNDSLEAPPSWDALEKYTTNSTPINLTHGAAVTASDAILGDFSQMMIGMRQNLTIELSREAGSSTGSAFANGQIWIRALLRADIALAHPEFFCVLDGIL